MWNIINFLTNVWRFRKELSTFTEFDSMDSISLFRRGLELNRERKFGGAEHLTDFNQKIKEKMDRAIEIMRVMEDDSWHEIAIKNLGISWSHEKESCINVHDNGVFEVKISKDDHKIILESSKIEDQWTQELWDILKGQDLSEVKTQKKYDKKYDGSGLLSWW